MPDPTPTLRDWLLGHVLRLVLLAIIAAPVYVILRLWLSVADVVLATSIHGDEITYRWSRWMTWLPLLFGGACLLAGFLLRGRGPAGQSADRNAGTGSTGQEPAGHSQVAPANPQESCAGTAGGCLLLLGAFPCVIGLVFGCVALFSPVAYEVKVDGEHFEDVSGDIWAPIRRNIRFESLREMHIDSKWSLGIRRGIPYPSHEGFLVVVYHAGQQEKIKVGGLLEYALPEIVRRARDKGIRIVDGNQ